MEANRFNHILLHQYLNGELDDKAMHELEKQALDDPFLADALEGYSEVAVPAGKHLSILQAQLAERIAEQEEKKNVLSFSWQRLSIAAAACLLFVISTVLLLMKSNKEQEQLASRPKQVEAALTNPDSILKSDDQTNKTPQAVGAAPDEIQIRNSGASENYDLARRIVRSKNESIIAPVPSHTDPGTGSAAANPLIAKTEAVDSLSGDEAILAKASSAVNSFQEMTPQQVTQSLQGRVAGVDARSDEKRLSSRRISAYGQAAARDSVYSPVGGWSSFENYLKINTNVSGRKIKTGIVTLSFKVSADGKPSDITVEKGLNGATNKEAIRLLQSGPSWQVAKDSTAKVSILFEK